MAEGKLAGDVTSGLVGAHMTWLAREGVYDLACGMAGSVLHVLQW